MPNDVFIKNFGSEANYQQELDGHAFLAEYTDRIPKIISTKFEPGNFAITYEQVIGPGVQMVSDAINTHEDVDLSALLTDMATVTRDHAGTRQAGGGTRLFYLDRLPRLDTPDIRVIHKGLMQNGILPRIDNSQESLRGSLLDDVAAQVSTFNIGLCVPSLGDFHERNVFTNGILVDFEGAGWNHVATDVATFIWHTLFVGNYLGPKYAKWSVDKDKDWLRTTPPQLYVTDGVVHLEISAGRRKLLKDYLRLCFNPIAGGMVSDKDVLFAMAFRLLTVFPVNEMSNDDQRIVFAISNFLTRGGLSLREALRSFDEDLEAGFRI